MQNTLSQWLERIEQLHPTSHDLSLERMLSLANRLNVRDFTCPVITVAGTNGKGSAVAYLKSVFSDYRVGVYTSPHLHQFNERICINSAPVTDEQVVEAFRHVEAERDQPLTFYEYITLSALWLFQRANLDLLILEVGLGGRLDATNVVDADVSVVTSIGLDHQDRLGDSIEAIAREKAGVFKSGRYAVCAMQDAPGVVSEVAEKVGVSGYFQCGRDFSFSMHSNCWNYSGRQDHKALPLPHLRCDLAAAAIKVVELLSPLLPVGYARLCQALSSTRLPGRFERWLMPMPIVFDVAHNVQAAQYLSKQIQTRIGGKVLAVFGAQASKDVDGIMSCLQGDVQQWYVADLRLRNSAMKMPSSHLLGKRDSGNEHMFPSMAAAMDQAMKDFPLLSAQAILVFGSFHAVSQGQHFLMHKPGSDRCK